MRKVILAFLFIVILFLITACANNNEKKIVCGDNICDSPESCSCNDCKKEDKCKTTAIIATCDDSNKCTDDIFNELTKQCEHKIILNCCGNAKCEEGERCNMQTYETACPSDCNLECPGHVIISEFSCVAKDNCRQIGKNSFVMNGDSKIKAVLTNEGERISGNINSEFKCDAGSLGMIKGDNANIKGITFMDYFDNNEQTASINSRVSKIGNTVGYYIEFKAANSEAVDLKCKATLQDDNIVDLTPDISLYFEK